jgi:photosystem II stability/assembly factor-like uncharacterized protein
MRSVKILFRSLNHFVLASLLTALFFTSAFSQSEKDTNDIFSALKFRNIGPAVAGGRVSSLTGVPGNPNIYYVGAANGGIFKSTNSGYSWKPIFEKEPVSSIGCVTLAPSNPNLVWVGTGEANIRNDIGDGGGIFFSPDAGANWQFMGLKDAGQIGKVIVDPDNPDVVFAAALGHPWAPNKERGLFKTTDGGKTWTKVLYINDSTGVRDVVFEPGNPKVMFAAAWQVIRHPWALIDGGEGSGIYKSTDGGDTWKKLDGNGLPNVILGRISFATCPSNPEHLYALIESKHGMLWETKDMGEHWDMITNNHQLDVRPFYFSTMEVSPDNDQRMYFLSFLMSLSTDGGKTVKTIGHGVHVDYHAIWIDPMNPKRILVGNDGGTYLSQDAGKTWQYFDNMPIEQFYQVATDTLIAYNIGGGLQDNDAWYGPSNNLNGGDIDGFNWYVTEGGDGEYVVPAPSNPNIIYSEAQDGFLNRLDKSTGVKNEIRPYLFDVSDVKPADLKYRFNWTSPIAVSYHDANTVYLGANVLFKSTNGGTNWTVVSPDLTRNDKSKQIKSGGPINLDMSGAETYDTILSIGLSANDDNVIWVGTDDGQVQVTRDGGKTWDNVTKNIPDLPEWGRVYQLDVSPFSPAKCYIAVDRHMMNDRNPYVYKTNDYGKSWTKIVNGLPDTASVFVVREDPNKKDFLFLGNERGLYYSHNDGGTWTKLKSGFPTAPVWDLKFVKQTHDLVAATHGRGIFILDDIIPIEDLTSTKENSSFDLFDFRPVYRFDRWYKGGFDDLDKYSAPNPPGGAIINYYLGSKIKESKKEKKEHESPVKIEIRDEQGSLVDTLNGTANKGVNRLEWNLHYQGPSPLAADTTHGRRRGDHNGPEALPGTYKISVTVNGETQTKSVEVKSDPRRQYDIDAAKEQFTDAMDVQNDISALHEMLNRIDNLKEQIKVVDQSLKNNNPGVADSASGYKDLYIKGHTIDSLLSIIKDTVYETKAQRGVGEDDIHYLTRLDNWLNNLRYTISGNYDFAPNNMMKSSKKDLETQLTSFLDKFNEVVSTNVADYNKEALSKGTPTLYVGGVITIK